uniref:Uncharacterized protein n=1 Tax=Glyptapanteles flavicoxis TaxID=463051 RepID=B7S8C0_9HYME|nr:hypothetical protein GFP_L3_0060 [Glyptapanteles flavicoxis]
MILKIIVPNAWSVLPSMTLQNELVGTVVKWQTTHESWQGAKGTYNGVTAELIQDDYDLWFRKFSFERQALLDMEIRRPNLDKFGKPFWLELC